MSLKCAVFFHLLLVAVADGVSIRGLRILGGSEAKPHEFPHMVTLNRDSWPHHFCGGAILNEYWVITAGHCPSLVRDGQSFRIIAGKHSLRTVEESEQVIKVAKVFVHEKYPGGVAPHDIALIQLEKPLVFNEFVQPIALPESNSDVDGDVVFSGWGRIEHEVRPDVLQKARFTVMDYDTCKKLDELRPPPIVTDTMLCATSVTNSIFACRGDSGGPLIKRENNQIRLVGIFSWLVNPCGSLDAPSVFTKVSSYVDWIEKAIIIN